MRIAFRSTNVVPFAGQDLHRLFKATFASNHSCWFVAQTVSHHRCGSLKRHILVVIRFLGNQCSYITPTSRSGRLHSFDSLQYSQLYPLLYIAVHPSCDMRFLMSCTKWMPRPLNSAGWNIVRSFSEERMTGVGSHWVWIPFLLMWEMQISGKRHVRKGKRWLSLTCLRPSFSDFNFFCSDGFRLMVLIFSDSSDMWGPNEKLAQSGLGVSAVTRRWTSFTSTRRFCFAALDIQDCPSAGLQYSAHPKRWSQGIRRHTKAYQGMGMAILKIAVHMVGRIFGYLGVQKRFAMKTSNLQQRHPAISIQHELCATQDQLSLCWIPRAREHGWSLTKLQSGR